VETFKSFKVRRFFKENFIDDEDYVVVEEPLTLISCYKGECEKMATIMRTPGEDYNLILGFLYTEGMINSLDEIEGIEERENTVKVLFKKKGWNARKLAINSSCGICGKEFLDLIETTVRKRDKVMASTIFKLPSELRRRQDVFSKTGGLHAAAMFNFKGELIEISEDIGRHNAVDKVIGKMLESNLISMNGKILQVSGRVGFEIVYKASRAGFEVVSGISSPSTMAIEYAKSCGITLIAFLRENKFNVYSFPERIL
jgi:FdhD protein